MKKYFKYELKRNLLPLIILTVFATVIYLASVLSTEFIYTGYPDGVDRAAESLIVIPFLILMGLCVITPIMMFFFKMKARQVDCIYSMPLKREKVYLVKSLVGLILVLAPYTVAYWLGFITTICKPNLFNLSAFIPAYFLSIPLAVVLFGINAFAFTRANSIWDGIIFMTLYSFVGFIFMGCLNEFINSSKPTFESITPENWTIYSPMGLLMTKYMDVIVPRNHEPYYTPIWLSYIFAIITGAAAWAGLFLTAKKEKAENAGRVSDSWFGYRVLIPFYVVFGLSMLDFSYSESLLYAVLIIVTVIVAYITFRRSFKLKAVDWLSLLGAVVIGVILGLIQSYLFPTEIVYCLRF